MNEQQVAERLDRAVGGDGVDAASRWRIRPFRQGWLAVRNSRINDGSMFLVLGEHVEMFQRFRVSPEDFYDQVQAQDGDSS